MRTHQKYNKKFLPITEISTKLHFYDIIHPFENEKWYPKRDERRYWGIIWSRNADSLVNVTLQLNTLPKYTCIYNIYVKWAQIHSVTFVLDRNWERWTNIVALSLRENAVASCKWQILPTITVYNTYLSFSFKLLCIIISIYLSRTKTFVVYILSLNIIVV